MMTQQELHPMRTVFQEDSKHGACHIPGHWCDDGISRLVVAETADLPDCDGTVLAFLCGEFIHLQHWPLEC